MLIEFFGLPGTGKSTMSRQVADLLVNRRLVVDEITYDLAHRRSRSQALLIKFAHIVRHAVAHPRISYSGLVRIASTRQATPRDLGKSIFNWSFICSIVLKARLHAGGVSPTRHDASRGRLAGGKLPARPDRIIFLDQGVAQAMWSVGFKARRETWLDLLLAEAEGAALAPDLIIHVQADVQTVSDRLAAREQQLSRMDALGRDQQALQRAQANGDAIIGRLRSGGIPVIDVESNDTGQLESGARLVADAIENMLGEQTGNRLSSVQHVASGSQAEVMMTQLGRRQLGGML